MSVISEVQHYQFASGLEVKLHHVPHLCRAAVVWIVPSGSHQEPPEWPGLAHLTEHMVFSGGTTFRDQQRLMPWVQQKGGRINATTQPNYTAYYFEIDPEDLGEGLSRLNDMLTAPCFDVAHLRRETTVIDEEYRLYCHSPEVLTSAALHSQVEYPTAFSQFHIGNLATFGTDLVALGDALQQFFSQHYTAKKSHVWIASPQSTQQQYQQVTSVLGLPSDANVKLNTHSQPTVSESGIITWQNWEGEIQLSQQPGLGISIVLEIETLSDWPLFVELMTDRAPGGLSQVMSQHLGRYFSVRVERHYHDHQQIWFTLWLEGTDFTDEEARECLLIWQRWLMELSKLTAVELDHYQHLAQSRALTLPAMEFLREYALGFIFSFPPKGKAAGRCLQQATSTINTYALLHSRRMSSARRVECQGLSCQFQSTILQLSCPTLRDFPFVFYPRPQPSVLPMALNRKSNVPLKTFQPSSERFCLFIRPATASAISHQVREELTRALSPVLSLAKHYAGEASWQPVMGNDLLYLGFKQFTDFVYCLDLLVKCWPKALPRSSLDDYEILPLRQLLLNMPSLLADDFDQWTVTYAGPSLTESKRVQALLGNLPINWYTEENAPQRFQQPVQLITQHDHATLIAFIPYDTDSIQELCLYQQLARYYESEFYHQLREVEAVGYAVACRERIFRDHWGLQIILQSSHRSAEQLYIHVLTFFRDLVFTSFRIQPHFSLDIEKSGNKDIDHYLQHRLFPAVQTTKQGGSQPLELEEAHHVLVEKVRRKEGRWIYIE
ncbi:insulinase family protein [Rosenbergiella australiborealis]|uniref:insulinase family protein n=1 Tax=Rosenbergiella australiborealis TaxID=1544696 RepID=UPI001F4E7E7B|nr:insulinase family protein [Rosenbergiella australiborealis]